MKISLGFKLIDGLPFAAEVEKERFSIGRSNKCDVVIPNEGLSREHCLVEIEEGDIYITDLASANGVLIDEERIKPNHRTQYNSSFALALGSIEVIKFQIQSQNLLELDHQDKIETFTHNPQTSARPASGSARKSSRDKGESSGPSGAQLHPGVKGVGLMVILAIGYFLFNQVMDSEPNVDDYSREHNESTLKKKLKDGSVRTRNF